MTSKRTFSWATRRDGNSGFVLEECPEADHRVEYGPMPAHVVPAFINARRKLVASAASRFGATKTFEPLPATDWKELQ